MNYTLKMSQKVLMFEIPFPRDRISETALSRVLDDFLSPERIRTIPAIEAYLDKHPQVEAALTLYLQRIISGYTIWPCVGRFLDETELSSIVRLVIYEPDDVSDVPHEMQMLAREVVLHLVCKRLAEELATQTAVWVLEYQECYLHRWERQPDTSPAIVLIEPLYNGQNGHKRLES